MCMRAIHIRTVYMYGTHSTHNTHSTHSTYSTYSTYIGPIALSLYTYCVLCINLLGCRLSHTGSVISNLRFKGRPRFGESRHPIGRKRPHETELPPRTRCPPQPEDKVHRSQADLHLLRDRAGGYQPLPGCAYL